MKIFVSYSRRDAGDFANQIQKHLSTFNYEIFTDINSIRAGENWSNIIEKNISNCDIFVVIVTHGALQSPHVEREVLQAQKENKKIIPCFLIGINPNRIKWGLEKIQGVEFSNEYHLARNLYSKIDIEVSMPTYQKNSKIDIEVSMPTYQKRRKITDLEKHLSEYYPNPRVCTIRAVDFHDDGKYQEAIEWCDKALRLDPNFVNAVMCKSSALYHQGKYQEAIEWCDKALRLDPNFVLALFCKGNALFSQGKYQEAIEWYDKALRVDPNNTGVLNNKGLALNDLGKYQEAIEWFDKTLRVDQNNANALNNKGWSLYNLGEYQKAIEWFDKTLIVDPNHPRTRTNKKLALEYLSK